MSLIEHTVIVQVKNDTLKFVSCNESMKRRTVFVSFNDFDIVDDVLHTYGTTATAAALKMDIRKQYYKELRSKKFFTSVELLPFEWAALKALLLKRMDSSKGKSEQYFHLTAKTV